MLSKLDVSSGEEEKLFISFKPTLQSSYAHKERILELRVLYKFLFYRF